MKHNHKEYMKLIRNLADRGLIEYRRQRRAEAALFCVGKKSGALRLIVDARQANRLLKDPPGIQLSSVEGIANIHVGEDDSIYIAKGDVANCFYRQAIEGPLVEYFAVEE